MRHIKTDLHIDLLPGGKILAVQRQHWLSLVFPLSLHVIIVTLVTISILDIIHQTYSYNFFIAAILFSLLLVTILALFGTFLVMDWFYHFYIVTNKRLISDHYFKLSGPYYEEVFLKENIESVDRIEKNIFYDAFGIEDVSVRFPSFDRSEPFTFVSPSNPEEIENLIEKFSLEKK